ncbi:MAG: hypothetical protein ACSLFQ_02225 [Thermoanaerobaculia bacterium]
MRQAAPTVASALVGVLFLVSGANGAGSGSPDEAAVRSAISRAVPLLEALERYRLARGDYPQYLDALTPEFLDAIPTASSDSGPTIPFVYHGAERSFELFFLPASSGGEHLVLYGSRGEYPQRREPGPYKLVRTVGDWAWYELIPMRNVELLRQWRGRVSLENAHQFPPWVGDQETLKTVWAGLGAQEPLPRIDFKTELVLVGVVRSGLVTFMQPVLDDKGDLKRNLVATPDAPSFRSYAVAVIAREGIRSIDGERVQ